jgi:hypothetical protein
LPAREKIFDNRFTRPAPHDLLVDVARTQIQFRVTQLLRRGLIDGAEIGG